MDDKATPLDSRDSFPARDRLICVALWCVLAGGSVVLFFRNPSGIRFLPPCLFHRLTGLHCPGCGSTRAAHQLLHGRVGAAFGHNLLLVIVLPFLVYSLLSFTRRAVTGRSLAAPFFPAKAIYAFLIVLIAFWVLRNVPLYPFTILAP